MINFIERVSIIVAALCLGFTYSPAIGLAALIGLDTLIDIRNAIKDANQ